MTALEYPQSPPTWSTSGRQERSNSDDSPMRDRSEMVSLLPPEEPILSPSTPMNVLPVLSDMSSPLSPLDMNAPLSPISLRLLMSPPVRPFGNRVTANEMEMTDIDIEDILDPDTPIRNFRELQPVYRPARSRADPLDDNGFSANLPTLIANEPYASLEGKCAICWESYTLDEMRDGDLTRTKGCDHIFHRLCLRRWINDEAKSNCPMCRKPIAETPRRIILRL
ncbi:hypothetical protein CC80DRAFT_552028 [Byssothecium circinans]|uniref:RING-type domain-containing protein n=1 Tax=Byssothecium circinans TaxID=147558 RepID=A0A6A5TLH0_9PLEO|nr:hypothetical protein CC80DRAFT_552028 [Byssothecium circinans]